MTLVGDRAWTVVADQGQLVASAGADVVWIIEDVPPSVVELVGEFWSQHRPDPDLALRLAGSGLGGCELGGSQDRAVLTMLGIGDTTARLALAYACGLEASDTSPSNSARRPRFLRTRTNRTTKPT